MITSTEVSKSVKVLKNILQKIPLSNIQWVHSRFNIFVTSDLQDVRHIQVGRICLQSSQRAGCCSSKGWNQTDESYEGKSFKR